MRRKRALADKVKRFFKLIYLKIFRINDTPQKIALGAGLGIFSGILPGTGPIAALFLAFLFRANRAAALMGSLVTNTWLSFFIFLPAIKAGSFILGVRWEQVHQECLGVFADFSWRQLLELSFLKIILPIAAGYLIIGFIFGAAVYLITFAFIRISKKRR
ncbi:MAG: DUF2062 domain-containing protein [Candidatus Omnitrophota bacterium]